LIGFIIPAPAAVQAPAPADTGALSRLARGAGRERPLDAALPLKAAGRRAAPVLAHASPATPAAR